MIVLLCWYLFGVLTVATGVYWDDRGNGKLKPSVVSGLLWPVTFLSVVGAVAGCVSFDYLLWLEELETSDRQERP